MDLQLPAVLAANEAYRSGDSVVASRPAQPARRLVILTCMDARLDPFPALGLALGEAHILRNAGGRASADAIRSLVVSAHLLGTTEVGVIHHTKCGMEGLTDEEAAVRTGVAGLAFLGFADLVRSVEDDVETILRCAHLPADFTAWGAVYDVDTGELRVVVEPQPV